MATKDPRSKQGFASMDEEKQRAIARKGGEAVPKEKRSFSQDRSLAAAAGRKGGESVPSRSAASFRTVSLPPRQAAKAERAYRMRSAASPKTAGLRPRLAERAARAATVKPPAVPRANEGRPAERVGFAGPLGAFFKLAADRPPAQIRKIPMEEKPLARYRAKRDFTKTSEPSGNEAALEIEAAPLRYPAARCPAVALRCAYRAGWRFQVMGDSPRDHPSIPRTSGLPSRWRTIRWATAISKAPFPRANMAAARCNCGTAAIGCRRVTRRRSRRSPMAISSSR